MTTLEAVIGLEVHIQLSTERKLFCGNLTRFGDAPNTHVCPVCLGLPGALPVLNPHAVELAVKAALALGCTVHETSIFARKNYFYPDLPKGYQISQFDRPLATGGVFPVETADGVREIRIRRIHMEEDAGKSIHDRYEKATAVDLNRTGTPLVELVSEPDFRTPAETRAWLQHLKQLIEYLEVSDCNMEEGSLRVDANISVRPSGSRELGTKTELKNLNSFSGVERALKVEIERQKALVAEGGRVSHQTLLWDEGRGQVRTMRSKEESHDYRYFPEPDLPPLVVTPEMLEEVRGALPELPALRRARFLSEYGLPEYDAGVLTATRAAADYYEEVTRGGIAPKTASNWVMGPVLAAVKDEGGDLASYRVRPAGLVELIVLVDEGTISPNVGKEVLSRMAQTGRGAGEIVEAEGLAQVSDSGALEGWIGEVLAAHPDEVARFRDGESRLRGYFMGEVMKRSGGKADPKEVNRILAERLRPPEEG
jgi:aspartyl-tRNA(Asn)/glutamyl-tRNA(Gln) amidotransferase subunit B